MKTMQRHQNKMRKFVGLGLFSLLFLLFFIARSQGKAEEADLDGQVFLNASAQTPLDNVLIEIVHEDHEDNDEAVVHRMITRSDGEGSFHFDNIPVGTYQIKASMELSEVHQQMAQEQDAHLNPELSDSEKVQYRKEFDRELENLGPGPTAGTSSTPPARIKTEFTQRVNPGENHITFSLIQGNP